MRSRFGSVASFRDIVGAKHLEVLIAPAQKVADTIFNRKHFLLAGIAFVTGFANVVTYIRFDQVYLTILTGNMIVGITALVEGEREAAILSVSVCLGYFFGAFATRYAVCELKINENLLTPAVLVLMSSLVYFAREGSGMADDIVAVSAFSFAMGIINTITSHLDQVRIRRAVFVGVGSRAVRSNRFGGCDR
jgi:uncharacterized membrane protein YoaK (UPF0700 family)